MTDPASSSAAAAIAEVLPVHAPRAAAAIRPHRGPPGGASRPLGDVIRLLQRPARLGTVGEAALPATVPGAGGPARALRVASYNVHKCVGTDGRFDPDRVAAVVGELGADLVALQEVDRRFGRRTGLLDPAAVRRLTGLVPLPVSDLPDGLGWHGNAVLVRPGTTWRLERMDLPGAEPRGAVIAELALPGGGGELRVVAAHFGLLRRCRARQAAAVLDAVARGRVMPTLLLGDLNEWRSERGGSRCPLRLLEPMFGPVAGGPASFPSRLPLFRLDRILGCPRARVLSLEAHETPLARLASDHLPLKAVVQLGAAAAEAAVPPQRAAA